MADNGSFDLTRHDFGPDFIFGAGTSAYQVEGAYNVGGKGTSIWDDFSMTKPDKIVDGDNACEAIDNYNRYKEDVLLMKKLGLDYYRFSISWTRILPGGKLSAGVSKEGIQFYNDLIDFMILQGIQPFVTLFHFDTPQSLEAEYGGFLDARIIKDFVDYVDVCFFEFGDRVKHWVTHNEPVSYTTLGYVMGTFPPGHGTQEISLNRLPSMALRYYRAPVKLNNEITVTKGDPGTEPYIVAHNLICSHAKAVERYRNSYQAVQGGKIGMVNMTAWYYPYDKNNPDDVEATSRTIDFMWGWFVEPMVTGDYPAVMRERVGDRLPKFSPEMQAILKGSYDFIGMNYYTSNFAAYLPNPEPVTNPTFFTDVEAQYTGVDVNGNPIGPEGETGWEYNVPQGLYDLLSYTKNKYNDPLIIITENGWGTGNHKTLTINEGRLDPTRITYHSEHLKMLKKAQDEINVNVKGYFIWSILDNYEWTTGFTIRFGIVYIDYHNNLARYPKSSAIWFMNFLNKKLLRSKRQSEEKDSTTSGTVKRLRNR